jgi:hypothetical protein
MILLYVVGLQESIQEFYIVILQSLKLVCELLVQKLFLMIFLVKAFLFFLLAGTVSTTTSLALIETNWAVGALFNGDGDDIIILAV